MEEPYFGDKIIQSSSFRSSASDNQLHKDETLSDIIRDETRNIVTFERSELSWNEIIIPITILTLILFGLVITAFILLNWIKQFYTNSKKLNQPEQYYQDIKTNCTRMEKKPATPPQTPDLPILVPVTIPVPITRSHQIFTPPPIATTTGTKTKIQQEWILHETTPPIKLQNDITIQPSSSDHFNYNFNHKKVSSDDKENEPSSSEQFVSPLMPSAGYKHGNYFKFPEVDVFTPVGTKICAKTDDIKKLDNQLTIATRRARLKSISLDSESARIVEENLGIGIEELVDTKPNPKNINHLTINLQIRDDSINCDDYKYNKTPTPKTPTFQQSRQKAISLDSDQQFFPNVLINPTQLQIVSVSVPTTPKRQSSTKKSSQKFLNLKSSGHLYAIRQHETSRNCFTRKLGSFEENIYVDEDKKSSQLGSNLQTIKQSLSVSNNNLKTLPEVMTLSDFNTIDKSATTITKNRSILQRRGSNQSLTLNLDDSLGNLTRGLSSSNYSLGNYSSVANKKNLLQRRGSNTSLTLNIQNSNASLNRFNSHSSLNILQQERPIKKGLLERRNSNASLTLNIEERGLSISNCNLSQEKFLSTDNLHKIQPNQSYGSIDNLKDDKQLTDGAVGGSVRNITTKPLSPQSTTEDFKIYLANIQFLQNASNILTEKHLKKLCYVFQNSYTNKIDLKKFDMEILSRDEFKTLIRGIHQEFWDLPTNYQEKPLVFGSQSKNRYKTILPNEHSRVILNNEDGCLIEPYVNANFIKGPDYLNNCYIATQGPMPNTIYEFWLMIYQNVKKTNNGYQKIAMLTDFIENNRQKCAIYFPTDEGSQLAFLNNQNEINSADLKANEILNEIYNRNDEEIEQISNNFNYFLIKNLGVTKKNGYTISKLNICYNNRISSESTYNFNCYHYWFPDWPDHRSPEDIDVLLDMSLDLLDEKFDEIDIQPLPIIHCSAGIGRTGCLAAILNGLRQMRTNQLSATNTVDILGIVCNLRLQRGGMVQNSEQYELIHRALCLYQQRLIEGLD